MSDLLKIKRGTLAQLKTYTPLEGEPVWATDLKKLYIGDGTTPLGSPIQQYISEPVTLYVTPSGSTTDTGFSWDQSISLLTAMNRAAGRNWSSLGDMVIQLGTGSYTLNSALPNWQCAPLMVVGSINNPALTTITTTYSHSYGGTFYAEQGGTMMVDGIRFSTTAAADANNQQRALVASVDGTMLIGRVGFTGNWDTHIMSVEHSYIETLGKNIDVSGWLRTAMFYADGHSTVILSIPTCSFSAAPTIPQAALAVLDSSIYFSQKTSFNGSANVTTQANLIGFSSLRLNGTVLPGTSYSTTSNLTGVI